MYRKLCKYEFKSLARTLLPIYLAVVIVSLINAVSFSLNDLFGASGFFGAAGDGWLVGMMQLVMMMAYFCVMVALFVLTLVVILQRFYKGLLCSEGYLMFTLPVKPWQLIAAKGTAAFVISLISTAAAGISILLLVCGVYNPTEVLSTLLDLRTEPDIPEMGGVCAAVRRGDPASDDRLRHGGAVPDVCLHGPRASGT